MTTNKATITIYARNHGVARRGPSARIAYAGTRNPQRVPTGTGDAAAEKGRDRPEHRADAHQPNIEPRSRAFAGQIRLPALNSERAMASPAQRMPAGLNRQGQRGEDGHIAGRDCHPLPSPDVVVVRRVVCQRQESHRQTRWSDEPGPTRHPYLHEPGSYASAGDDLAGTLTTDGVTRDSFTFVQNFQREGNHQLPLGPARATPNGVRGRSRPSA